MSGFFEEYSRNPPGGTTFQFLILASTGQISDPLPTTGETLDHHRDSAKNNLW